MIINCELAKTATIAQGVYIPEPITESGSGVIEKDLTVNGLFRAKNIVDGHVALADRATEADNLTAGSTDWTTIKNLIDAAVEVCGTENTANITTSLKELYTKFISKTTDDIAAGRITFKKGIALISNVIDGLITSSDDIASSDTKILSALKTLGTFLRKDAEDTAAERITFKKGITAVSDGEGNGSTAKDDGCIIQTDDFLSGATGLSVWRDGNGRICGEVDKLTVRLKAIFNELEIRRLSYVGGNVILSPSGSVITKVEEVTETTTTTGTDGVEDTTTTVTGYKCYFKTDDGTTATTNTWQKGDLAMCQTFNIKAGTYTNVANKYYWRLVTEDPGTTADGKQGYFVLGAGAGQYDTTSEDVPKAGDTIVMRGNNIANSGRNSVIELITSGGEPRISLVTDITGFGSDKQTEIGRISPSETFFATKRFRLIGYDGMKRPVAYDRGEWSSTAAYYFYDRVSHNGQLWLLDGIADGESITGTDNEPKTGSTKWTLQVSKGDKGDDGTGINLDLTNETDSVITLSDGKIVTGKTLTFGMCLYDGAQKRYFSDTTNPVTVVATASDTGISTSIEYSTSGDNTVTVTVSENDYFTLSTAYVDIACTYKGQTYTKRFNIKRIIGTAKYEIVTSPSAVKYNPNTKTFDSDITVSIYKTEANAARENIASIPSGFALKYKKIKSSATTAVTVTSSDYSSYYTLANSGFSSDMSGVLFTLYDASGVLLDSETVPIVSDGTNGTNGTDGTDGTDGDDGITLVMSPDVLEFSTDTDGLAELTNNTCTVSYIGNGGGTPAITLDAASGCTASVSGGVITITSVDTQTVSGKTISVGSGYVDFTANCGGTTISGRLRFNVSINALWSSVGNILAEYTNLHGQITTIDGNLTTMQTDITANANAITSTASEVTEQGTQISEIKQTATEISLKVDTQTNKNNLLTGTAFRKQDEFKYNNSAVNCMIVKNGGYGGTNAVYVNEPKTSYQVYRGLKFANIEVKPSTAYIFTVMVKSPDLTSFTGSGDASNTPYCEIQSWYKENGTSYHETIKAGSLRPSKAGEWQLMTFTFNTKTNSDGNTRWIDILFYVISFGQIYFCRPMLQEGDTYGGWSMSKQDYDYIGGNMLGNTRTLTDPSGLNTVPWKLKAATTTDNVDASSVSNTFTATEVKTADDDTTVQYQDVLSWGGQVILEAGQDYIFSAYVKGSGYLCLHLYYGSLTVVDASETCDGVSRTDGDGFTYIKLTSEYRRIWVHWHTKKDIDKTLKYSLVAIRQYYKSNDAEVWQNTLTQTVYMKQPKLERGATMTDYSESGDDMVSKAQLLATGIDIKNREITLTADKTIVQSNGGTAIVVFGVDSDDNPYISADLIKADAITASKIAQPFEQYANYTAFKAGSSYSWYINNTSISDFAMGVFNNGIVINIYNATEYTMHLYCNVGYNTGTNGFMAGNVYIPKHTLFRAIAVDTGIEQTSDGITYALMFYYILVPYTYNSNGGIFTIKEFIE